MKHTSKRGSFRAAICVGTMGVVGSLAGSAAATPGVDGNARVSFAPMFTETNGHSQVAGMSADARFITYWSDATNILGQDTNTRLDLYRYDRLWGGTLLISMNTSGQAGDGAYIQWSSNARLVSPDGRFILFSSSSSDLVSKTDPQLRDDNGMIDVFLRDTSMFGSTQRVSLGRQGTQLSGESRELGMSANAQKILFATTAKLVDSDNNNNWDVYVYDRTSREPTLVSSNAAGAPMAAWFGAISEDGTKAVVVTAGKMLDSDTNGVTDVYWRDLNPGGQIRLASVSAAGVLANGASMTPEISADGQSVAFTSSAFNLLAPNQIQDTNGAKDVYVKNMTSGAVLRASTLAGGVQHPAPGCGGATLSGNGRIVAMHCTANDLVGGDTNGAIDVFTKDLDSNALTLVSRRQSDGVVGNWGSGVPVLSKDGAQIGFSSSSSNFVTPETQGKTDAFVGLRQ